MESLSGSFVLLVITYLIYLVRYPTWRLFTAVEQIFVMLILSYFAILLLALFFLKKDMKKSLSSVFKTSNYTTVAVGLTFALLFQGSWYLISFLVGSRFEFVPFLSLRGYENYAVYSVLSGFAFYLAFAVFGAFAEEVAYRGYVQSRISAKYGYMVGVLVATLFFSLQHTHIFELNWVERFFQTQFVYVLCFGIFVGYLFFKSRENIWSVFSFHALVNVFNVSLPIAATTAFAFADQLVTVISFILLILLLRYLF